MIINESELGALLPLLWKGGKLLKFLLEIEADSWRCWVSLFKSWHGAGLPYKVCQVESGQALVLLCFIANATTRFLLLLHFLKEQRVAKLLLFLLQLLLYPLRRFLAR